MINLLFIGLTPLRYHGICCLEKLKFWQSRKGVSVIDLYKCKVWL